MENCPHDGAKTKKEFLGGIPTWICPICGYFKNSMGRSGYKKIEKTKTIYVPQEKCNYCGHNWIRRKLTSPTKCPKCGKPYQSPRVIG
jgi:rubrerythrin